MKFEEHKYVASGINRHSLGCLLVSFYWKKIVVEIHANINLKAIYK
jgi:hypothetical protein